MKNGNTEKKAPKGKKARLAERKDSPLVKETQVRLGSRIKSLRSERRLTQGQLAEMVGMSQKYLGEVERGIRNVSLEAITVLAGALGVPTASILENSHEQTKDALLAEINRMVILLSEKERNPKDIQLVYRLLKMITEQ